MMLQVKIFLCKPKAERSYLLPKQASKNALNYSVISLPVIIVAIIIYNLIIINNSI
jgi:hypothetical protein